MNNQRYTCIVILDNNKLTITVKGLFNGIKNHQTIVIV